MNLNIRPGTVKYNNKILVSDEKFSLGKNDKVNALDLAKVVALEPSIKNHKVVAEQTHAHELARNQLMKRRKLPLFSFWQVVLPYGIFFDELAITTLETAVSKILYDS